MIFRLYHETRGAHVHCRLFAGPREGALGKCGDLVMRAAEFHAFVDRFPGMEFRKEGISNSGGPSSGALDSATKILEGLAIGPTHEVLHARIANALQEKFDLGHKSAGGAQCDKVPAMGGLLEIALDQEEIDVIGNIVEMAEPKGERACAAVNRFIEKIALFRRHPR